MGSNHKIIDHKRLCVSCLSYSFVVFSSLLYPCGHTYIPVEGSTFYFSLQRLYVWIEQSLIFTAWTWLKSSDKYLLTVQNWAKGHNSLQAILSTPIESTWPQLAREKHVRDLKLDICWQFRNCSYTANHQLHLFIWTMLSIGEHDWPHVKPRITNPHAFAGTATSGFF